MIMKLVAALCAILVCASFAGRVRAQTYTPGELRATKVVADAQDRADAIRRRMDAPTLTPVPTPTETETPLPTATPTPTLAPIATKTVAPSATNTQIVVIQTIQITVQVTIQTAPEKKADGASNVGLVIVGTLLFVLIFGAVVLFRPQTYMLPFRGGKRDE